MNSTRVSLPFIANLLYLSKVKEVHLFFLTLLFSDIMLWKFMNKKVCLGHGWNRHKKHKAPISARVGSMFRTSHYNNKLKIKWTTSHIRSLWHPDLLPSPSRHPPAKYIRKNIFWMVCLPLFSDFLFPGGWTQQIPQQSQNKQLATGQYPWDDFGPQETWREF